MTGLVSSLGLWLMSHQFIWEGGAKKGTITNSNNLLQMNVGPCPIPKGSQEIDLHKKVEDEKL